MESFPVTAKSADSCLLTDYTLRVIRTGDWETQIFVRRRILKKIAEGKDNLGDTSTLADPSVVDAIMRDAPKGKSTGKKDKQ